MKRYLRVREFETGKIVSEIEVTGKNERQIERIEMGMLINMDTDKFCIDDSAKDETGGEG